MLPTDELSARLRARAGDGLCIEFVGPQSVRLDLGPDVFRIQLKYDEDGNPENEVKLQNPNLIVLNGVPPKYMFGNIIPLIGLQTGNETPIAIVHPVTDGVDDSRSLFTSIKGLSSVSSSELRRSIGESGLTLRFVDYYRLDESLNFENCLSAGLESIEGPWSDGLGERPRPRFSLSCFMCELDPSQRSTSTRVATALARCEVDGDFRVLLQKRQREGAFWDFWELPQGHVVRGESVSEAALRELVEETGIRGTVISQQPYIRLCQGGEYTLTETTLFESSDETISFFAVGVLIDVIFATPNSNEHKEFLWASAEDVSQLLRQDLVYPPNTRYLADFVKSGWE